MITTKAMPALLPAHHRRVAEATIKNDFADPLGLAHAGCREFRAAPIRRTATPLGFALPVCR
jgi:hypothetical protein